MELSYIFQYFLDTHPKNDLSTHHELAYPADTLTGHRPGEGEIDSNGNNKGIHLLKTHCAPAGVIALPI